MPDVTTIPASELESLLWFEENHYQDVKRVDIKPSKLSETISAFANTSGGEVLLGICEEKENNVVTNRWWQGFPDVEAANAHLRVLESLSALGNHYSAEFIQCEGQPGYVLHLTVPKSRGIINATDTNPYIRVNAQNLRVDTEDKLNRLRLDKGVVTFEDETVSIDKEVITNSANIIEFLLNVVPSAEPEQWLRSQFLLNKDQPAVAGVLLFSDEPQAALPKRSAIKILRYKTKDDEGTRETLAFEPITIEGCIYSQIYAAVAKTKELVEGLKKLGVTGLEDVNYPHETLHEVVTNAVLHRDYSIPADIQIRIYDNRIEVESPGRLPGHVTVQNALKEQSARNPKVVRLIHKFPDPPNKDVGEGLDTAFRAMKDLRLKEPEIEERENTVIVHIAHAPLASPEDTVMEYMKGHDEITNRVGRDLTGIRSENTMKEVFYRLAKRKLIERVPDRRGNASAWRLYTGAAEVESLEEDDATGGLFD